MTTHIFVLIVHQCLELLIINWTTCLAVSKKYIKRLDLKIPKSITLLHYCWHSIRVYLQTKFWNFLKTIINPSHVLYSSSYLQNVCFGLSKRQVKKVGGRRLSDWTENIMQSLHGLLANKMVSLHQLNFIGQNVSIYKGSTLSILTSGGTWLEKLF